MEAPACEEGFRTLTKTLGDWRNTRVKQNTRTAMEEGLKKKNPKSWGATVGILCVPDYLSLARRLRQT